MSEDQVWAIIDGFEPRTWRVTIDGCAQEPVLACSARAAVAAARSMLLASRIWHLDYGYRVHVMSVVCDATSERMFAAVPMCVTPQTGVSTMY